MRLRLLVIATLAAPAAFAQDGISSSFDDVPPFDAPKDFVDRYDPDALPPPLFRPSGMAST